MTVNTASAEWRGNLATGKGVLELGNGAFKGQYSFKSRFEGTPGTNPEELIAAAHAACFSMAFSHQLAEAGFPPNALHTEASVTLTKNDAGIAISKIVLKTRADVPNVSAQQFQELGEKAKIGCPVSKALAGVPEIVLDAQLKAAQAA